MSMPNVFIPFIPHLIISIVDILFKIEFFFLYFDLTVWKKKIVGLYSSSNNIFKISDRISNLIQHQLLRAYISQYY